MPSLFDPLPLGELTLPHRILMAPLTRSRAGATRTPDALMTEYYRQRASAALILSEATSISPLGVGYADTPGIWSGEQIAGWRAITDAVHAAGGRIFSQLWHVGRVSDPVHLDGALPVAPSPIPPPGHVTGIRPKRPYVTPRALALEELPGIVADYRRAAENAQAAGFDGVEIHAANGYLLDQFLQDSSNRRADAYGGPIENRARLLLEVTDAAISVWGSGRVGVHLAPRGDYAGMGDSNPSVTFGYVARELATRRIAFLFLREFIGPDSLRPQLARDFGGPVIANENLTPAAAAGLVATGGAAAVAFGELFIANPDLPRRIRENAPLNAPHPDTFNTPGPTGYIDYPPLR